MKFHFSSKKEAQVQKAVILYLKSDAGRKLLVELTKNSEPNCVLDTKSRKKVVADLKKETIPEVRDQFLKAVSEKIKDCVQSAEDNITNKVECSHVI